MLTLPSENGAPGRVSTYAEPALCILRLDEDVAGATDRTAIGATKAVEEAMRVAAVPRNSWVEVPRVMLLEGVGGERHGVREC